MVNLGKCGLMVCISTLFLSGRVHAEKPTKPNSVTFKPLSLYFSMLHGRWEQAFSDLDSTFGGIGLGSMNGVSLFAVEGGYRRYVAGTFESGMFVSPTFAFTQASMFGVSVGVSTLSATLGGKHTFPSTFVLEGELGVIIGAGTYPGLDVGPGWAF